jgi:hypothetical protein
MPRDGVIAPEDRLPAPNSVVSATTAHDILISLWEFNMPSSDAFTLPRSGLNEFLFAAVGTEANGMTLSLISVFARVGDDPWREAGRLAGLPKLEAIESLARIIAGMPATMWPLPAATAIATRLIALLPTSSAKSGLGLPASAYGARTGRLLTIGLALVGIACAAAYQAGVFTTTGARKPDGNGVAGFVASPR